MQATHSPKAIDLRPAILASLAAALFIAGIALGSVMDLGIASTPAAAVVVPDTSYDAAEGARAQFGVAADTSYNAVEGARAQFGVTDDASLSGKSGYPSSRGTRTPSSATSHDLARATGGWWASAPIITDPAPVPGDRDGPGYR
jgi:hypothetical protein